MLVTSDCYIFKIDKRSRSYCTLYKIDERGRYCTLYKID